MLTSAQCIKKYGIPEKESNMVLMVVPSALKIGVIPAKIYCNKDMVEPLKTALRNVVGRNLVHEIKSWDGCFNIRKKRGASTQSLHSWGVAIDINAAWNQFGKKPTMSKELVACFTEAGFDWGGVWTKPDGMHFQLKLI